LEKTVNKLLQAIRIVAIVTIFLALSNYLFLSNNNDIEAVVREVIPQAEKFKVVIKDTLVYEGKINDITIGYAVLDETAGYQSNIKIMTGVDTQGKITGVYVVEQQETPAFFRQLVENLFFEQFLGKEIHRGFSGENIDAIGGATISSYAVINAVNSGTNYVGNNYLHLSMSKGLFTIF